jgi:NAD(P)-dependent dehydrogenase (short-subunit alcohol dehydrogenase family)
MPERAGLDLRDRSVVVTGAAGGIGAALARRFGQYGARLTLLDVDEDGLESLEAELGASGVRAVAARCDVTDPTACRSTVDDVVAREGGVDVMVNNAGVTHLSRFADTHVDVMRRVMDVNFFGAVHITGAALPSLVARRGQIVVISSVAGFAPLAFRCGYAASKHALHGCFESLRAELRGTGVGVTIVCPSFVRTAIGDHALRGDVDAPSLPRTEVGTPAEPLDLAAKIVAATARRQRLLLDSRVAKLSYVVSRLAPSRYERLMARRMRG